MKFIFSSILFLFFNQLFCQITIVNQYDLPISGVELSSNKHHIIAKSNVNGVVEWNKLESQRLTDTIYFNHLSYNSKWILKKHIKTNDTIVLTEKNHHLSEVLVSANNGDKKYQTINACYRSYQTNEDSLIYYTDGLVEYMTKIKKNNYQKSLKEYRVYRDSAYLANIVERQISGHLKLAWTSPPLTEYLPDSYFKRKDLLLYPSANGNIEILTKDSVKIGLIKKDSNLVTIFIDDIFKCKSRKLANSEAIQLKCDVTLVFSVPENSEDTIIDSFDNLVYSKIYRKYNYKHEKDKEYIEIENVDEIFVEDVNQLYEIDTDNYSKNFGLPAKSNFSTPFWEKCNCELYQIPPYTALELAH